MVIFIFEKNTQIFDCEPKKANSEFDILGMAHICIFSQVMSLTINHFYMNNIGVLIYVFNLFIDLPRITMFMQNKDDF